MHTQDECAGLEHLLRLYGGRIFLFVGGGIFFKFYLVGGSFLGGFFCGGGVFFLGGRGAFFFTVQYSTVQYSTVQYSTVQ